MLPNAHTFKDYSGVCLTCGATRELLEDGLIPLDRCPPPAHHGGCSNQNALHPVGKYIDAERCACRRPSLVSKREVLGE
jgi:hypothetical protein